MKKLLVGLLFLLAFISVLNANGTTDVKGAKVISAKKAEYLQRNGKALLLDARSFKLYLKGTIVGSLNLPVKKYDTLKKLLPSKDTKLITFCNGYKCEKSDKIFIKSDINLSIYFIRRKYEKTISRIVGFVSMSKCIEC